MEPGIDYVVTNVTELGSGDFEVSATLLSGPGHRVKVLVRRHVLESIPVLTQRAMEQLRPLPGGRE